MELRPGTDCARAPGPRPSTHRAFPAAPRSPRRSRYVPAAGRAPCRRRRAGKERARRGRAAGRRDPAPHRRGDVRGAAPPPARTAALGSRSASRAPPAEREAATPASRWRSGRAHSSAAARVRRGARAIAWPAAPSDRRGGASDRRHIRRCRDGSRFQRVYLPQMAHPALETAAPLVPESPTLEKLRAAAAGCTACPLYKTGTQTVFGEGMAPARAVFIGEQPGDSEDKLGRPFVGPAGKLLDRALEQAIMATVHPSSILRAPDEESRHREMELFVRDLRRIAPLLHH